MTHSVRWFAGQSCVGVVRVDNGYEIKYYIGVGKGYDEQDDIAFIASFGSTFPTDAGEVLFR